jgi:hypothetical protein
MIHGKPLYRFVLLVLGVGMFCLPRVRGDAGSGVFGQSQQSEAAMIGVMYDLKQTPTRQPTIINADTYWNVLDEFLTKHWDEAVFNRYYRVSRPIFTTQIFISNMSADNAPKAFGAEKTVQPSLWVIHYKAQVSAPSAGTYRFWGEADDALAVAVNGQTELVAFLTDPVLKNGWKEKSPRGGPGGERIPLDCGDWFTLGQDEIMDLDVIIGERPGGSFNAFLLVEKKGETYRMGTNGFPVYPIFQIAPYDTPVSSHYGVEPEFARGFPPWKSYQ